MVAVQGQISIFLFFYLFFLFFIFSSLQLYWVYSDAEVPHYL